MPAVNTGRPDHRGRAPGHARPRGGHDAWLVDLDGTLYRPLPVKLALASELALGGLRAAAVVRRFRAEHESLRRRPPEDDDPFHAQLERTALALSRPAEEVEAIVREWMIDRPGKWLRRFRRRDLLAELGRFRAAGGRLALVSDYPASHKLSALGCSELFEIVVACGESDGPRRLKPDPDGYLRAAHRLGVAPERCQVIGDRADADGEAARRAGMAFRQIG